MITIKYIKQFLSKHNLDTISDDVLKACQQKINQKDGNIENWQKALLELPQVNDIKIENKDNILTFLGNTKLSDADLKNSLQKMHPWRKGPFQFFDIFLDTEWKSNSKWQRIKDLNINFENKKVLDIGCGNGYFLHQLEESGAKSIVGIDPMWLFFYQFMVFQKYLKSEKICFLPLKVEDFPEKKCFDTILSMGVIYHRKSPLEHLFSIKEMLNDNGELILETIVLNDKYNNLLTPKDRYAGMRNVWMLTSVSVLESWLEKVGFEIIKSSKVQKTTFDEQRQTEFMSFHSLNQFLDKDNLEKTIEGHPAPYRVIIHARKR